MDAFSLEERTAVVTGTSRGIGAAIATALDAGGRTGRPRRPLGRIDLTAVAAGLAHEPVVLAIDLAEPDAPMTVAAAARSRWDAWTCS